MGCKSRNILVPLAALACMASFPSAGNAKDMSYAKVQRGHYLVTAGDCIACHTADGGQPFAGGRPIQTPFGIIYSPNLTPDRQTGIGAWSEEDFYRAMHEGIGPDGTHFYPAFPYTYFTHMTRKDISAIRAYLDTLPPVKNDRKPTELMWPLNYRVFMRGWNWMFFDPGTFKPDPDKSAEWNRGAYLVTGAAHCGACHTPKNLAGAEKEQHLFQGGEIQNWFAPKLTDEKRAGLGSWSVDNLVEYLKTGRNKHAGATGLMAEVVANSTSRMTTQDLHAMAVYIKSLDGEKQEPADEPDQEFVDAGAAIFSDSCSGCHRAEGQGVPRMFPPLAHNANVQSKDPTTIIRVILEGARTVPTDKRPTAFSMPAFDWKLDDEQVAAVATYVRNAWGNSAPAVTEDDVKAMRKELQASAN